MPSGLGSIEDYEHQDESSYSQGYPAGVARPSGISGMPVDLNGPNRNRPAVANGVILGALVIGLFALEVHAAHQHRHR